jgi:hypothetical protein
LLKSDGRGANLPAGTGHRQGVLIRDVNVRFVAVAGVLVAVSLVGAAIVPAAEPPVEVPATVEPAPIAARGSRGRHPVEDHSLGFSVDVSPCRGPGLTLDHDTVVERPATDGLPKSAIITAYLLHPAHIEREKCPKVRRIRFARVRTKRPAADLVFFDGSSSPPRRIFPLHRSPRR